MCERWPGLEEEIKRWEDAGRHLPTQDQIDVACDMIGQHKGNASESKALREFLQPLGITISKVSEEIKLVYWSGDLRVKVILGASLEELPGFLSSEDDDIRQLAKWRLNALTNDLDRMKPLS